MAAPTPKNEQERLRALRRYDVLDTPLEDAFDRVTRLAKTVFNTPIALVSLVDENRQWFKSRQGLEVDETSREIAFCAHAILANDVMVVNDATRDPRFAENPLVVNEPCIRFYAGAPLRTIDGYNLGTLCVIDLVSREFSHGQRSQLADLASIVVDQLELRLAAKGALRDSEERYYSLVRLSPDAIIVETDVKVVFANDAAATLLRALSIDDLLNRRTLDFYPAEAQDDVIARRSALTASQDSRVPWVERQLVCFDGTRADVEASATRIDWDGKPSFLIIYRDVTDRKAAERAARDRDARLRDLQRKLADASRLGAAGQLSSAIAHELNQPLTAIGGFLQAGCNFIESLPAGGTDKARDMMGKALDQSRRAAEIVQGLRDMATKGQSSFRQEDANDVIAEACALAIDEAEGKRIDFDLNLEDSLPRVEINRVQIQQVALNLLRNSVDAMANSPVRRLSVATHNRDDRFVDVVVIDSGPGISSEMEDRLFEPFASSKTEGMGLGLAISKSIISAHGGELTIRPNEGGGTKCRFALPVVDRAERGDGR